MSLAKAELKKFFDDVAEKRDSWKARSRHYHSTLKKIARFYVPEDDRVLEVGCGTGDLLAAVKPREGIGIDFSKAMLQVAKQKYSEFEFIYGDAEDLRFDEKFDYILFSDLVGYLEDVQKAVS